MAQNAPGKHRREGISLMQLADMFPDEEAARIWFEKLVWPNGRYCPCCGGTRTHEASHAKMPYRCTDCRAYFSVKTGTLTGGSRVSLRKWAFAIYLEATSLKGVSSMKLHRDIDVTQKTAWFMLHRIREAWAGNVSAPFSGPVEVDETYMGGRRKNMSNAKRKALREAGAGRGSVGKTAVVGAKDRATKKVAARPVERTDAPTLQGFVAEHAAPGATVYTEHGAYRGMPFPHETVNHGAGEYVRGDASVNGMEAFWSMFERSYHGTFHKIRPKHLQRYVNEFCAHHNLRPLDTIELMGNIIAGMIGKRLMYRDLIADNGLSSGARGA